MRRRPAPSAARSAISFRRATARASIRFATFAHAMTSTSDTKTPSMPSTSQLLAPVMATSAGTTRAFQPVLVTGWSCCSCLAMVSTSAEACATVAPGFSRP